MKRLAIFIGGLLVMPAFAEVAPIFIDDENALEYTDAMYDENGFLIIPDEEVVEETTETVSPKTPVKVSRQPVSGTPVANRSTSTRAMPASSSVGASGRGTAAGNSSRVVASRSTTGTNTSRAAANRAVNSRAATNVSPRTATTTATTSTRSTTNTTATRAAAARATGGASRTAATTTASVKSGVARTATTAGRATGARTTTNVSRAATTDASRPSVRTQYVGAAPKVGDGVPTVGTVQQIGGTTTLYNKSASIRTPTTRMSTLTETSVAMSMEDMDDLAEMTDYCKAQYASCMDNYCNVLDDNQGRCSCSANLKNYAKAEAALKSATEELQDVAQKIQYIGLTKREVESLFTQTAAEAAMQSAGKDTSQLQTSLDKIKDMIIDVKSGGATSNAGSDFGFDLSGLLEFSFDSTGFDLGSLFGTSNTNSVNNQRGEQLYKTAAARCKTSVIKACTARGVDASLITNAYDLEIDRECIMYERSLNDSNDEMLATVRNAKNVLQKARLMVAQQKNTYDMRGCINALDECMQDDFVCGSEYENCLDPTGRYIVNGEIVVGSQPGHAIDPELRDRVASVMTSDVCRVNLYRTWDFPGETCVEHTGEEYTDIGVTYEQYPSTYAQNNAWGSGTGYGDNLVNYIEKTVKKGTAKKASENMSQYLQNKIGYVDAKEGRNYGMCISVLNKCQDYTYTGKGTSATYNEENDVIKQYLGRVLVQIKAKQDAILSEYAETCVTDVTSCLSQNGYPDEDPNEWEAGLETTTNTTKANIAVNACRAQVVTCMSVNGYSIDTPTPTEMNCWVQGLLYNYTTPDCLFIKNSTIQCSPTTLRYCEDKSSCDANSGYWCASTTSCYSSLSEYVAYCAGSEQPECEKYGGTWCPSDGRCHLPSSDCGAGSNFYTLGIDCSHCGGASIPSTTHAQGATVYTLQSSTCLTNDLIDQGWSLESFGCYNNTTSESIPVSKSNTFQMPSSDVTCVMTCNGQGGGGNKHEVQISYAGCGSLTQTSMYAEANQTVNLTTNLEAGYAFSSGTCTGANSGGISVTGNGTFSMPAQNVTCSVSCNDTGTSYSYTEICGSTCTGSSATTQRFTKDAQESVNFSCAIPSGMSQTWTCINLSNDNSPMNVSGNGFTMPAGNVQCVASCGSGGGGGNDNFAVTVKCGTNTTGGTSVVAPDSHEYTYSNQALNSTFSLADRCIPPEEMCLSGWTCNTDNGAVQITNNSFTVTADTLCKATYTPSVNGKCSGGGNGGGDNPATECTQNGGTYCPNGVCVYDGDCNDNYDEPGNGQAVVKFICDPNDSYNPANLNIPVLTGAFNSGAVDSHTFVSTVQAGNHTLPAGACTCTNGTFQNWIVDTTCPSRNTQVNKDLNMQEGCIYTFTPNCEPTGGGDDDCVVTFSAASGCPASQGTSVACNDTKTNVPNFYAPGGAQTWTCNPANIVTSSSLTALNDNYGSGSIMLNGTPGACTAMCIAPGELDLECGEGTSIAGVTRHFVANNNERNVTVQPILSYCTAPNGMSPNQWECSSNTVEETEATPSGTINNTIPLNPGELLTCTAQWTGGSTQSVKLTVDCNGGTFTGSGGNSIDTLTNTPFTLDSALCTYDGHTLSGWICDNTPYGPSDSISISGPTTCSAQWSNSGGTLEFNSITFQGATGISRGVVNR